MFSRFVCLLSAGVLLAQTAPDPGTVARGALDKLLAQKYSELAATFTPRAKTAYPETALAKLGSEIESWGKVQGISNPSLLKVGPATIVTFQVRFATQTITFRFSVTEDGAVAAMLHSPAEPPYQHPSYSKPDSFKEREVTVAEAPNQLPGTLTVPVGAGPFPGIVLVHYDGPGDRDESIGLVKVFRDLAEGLASHGVVVLRYEKRTREYPSITQSKDYTVEQEVTDDAVKALALLRTQPEVKPGRVFLLGYGLGGYLAPRIAEADGKLAGMVIMNANARPLEDVALDEAKFRKVSGPQLQLLIEQAAKIKKLTQADEDTVPLLGMQGVYLLDLQGYNPAAQAKQVGIPMLILQGERDFRLGTTDFAVWRSGLAGQKNVTMKSYPALDRVMVAGDGPPSEEEERKPGQHVAQDVVDDIAKWVNQ